MGCAAPPLELISRKRCRCEGSALDRHTHRASGALNDLHRGLDAVGVEVGHLGVGDLANLVAADLAHLVGQRVLGPLLDPGSLLDCLLYTSPSPRD